MEQKLNLTHMVRMAGARDEEGDPGAGTPGLLLLHGRGADEADLMGLEEALDERLTVVSARAPFRLGAGYAWYGMSQVGHPDRETLHASVEELRRFISDMPSVYGIDPQRLYLAGFSMGAVMSVAMSLLTPDKVRGVVMHSGYVPITGGLDLNPEGVKGKGYFVAHGKYDDVIPVTFGRDAQEYLEAAEARIVYNEYPIGHTISEESLYDLSEWLTGEIDDGMDKENVKRDA